MLVNAQQHFLHGKAHEHDFLGREFVFFAKILDFIHVFDYRIYIGINDEGDIIAVFFRVQILQENARIAFFEIVGKNRQHQKQRTYRGDSQRQPHRL